MKQILFFAAPACLWLAGCGAGVEQVKHAADSARGAAERLAANSEDASNAREAQIVADAEGIEERAAAEARLENGGRPRYEIRKDGDTWTVYDTENNRPARVGPKLQSGLSHDNAEATFEDLQREEEQAEHPFAPLDAGMRRPR
jgi:hypothetical protein